MANQLSRVDPQHGGNLVAAMSKENLRSLFYLFAGKPDSRIKIFNDPISISPQDIYELNSCVTDKLKTHNIDLVITTVRLGYDSSQFNEFSTWAEFESSKWQESDKIEELVIKWDFLVNIQEYAVPQRHTLLFRVATDIKPSQLLQMIGSSNAEDLDQLDEISAPAFCRVDFINAQISKELVALVDDWYKGRTKPKLINPILFWFKKRRNGIATIADHWLYFSWALLLSSFVFWGANNFLNEPNLVHASIAVILAVYSFRPASMMAHRIGAKIYKVLSEIEGSKVLFNFTAGDRKRIEELEQENAKQGRKFAFISIWNVLLNVASGLITVYLFSKGVG